MKPTPEEDPLLSFDSMGEGRSEPISVGMYASILDGKIVTQTVLLKGDNLIGELVFNDGLVPGLPRSEVRGTKLERGALTKIPPIDPVNAIMNDTDAVQGRGASLMRAFVSHGEEPR